MISNNLISKKPNYSAAVRYLRKNEWSMGNGQCPDCCGSQPGKWDFRPECKEGHKFDCLLAGALSSFGDDVYVVYQ